MRGVIRLNDPTSHGGKVVGAAPNSTVLGVAVARKGDPCARSNAKSQLSALAEASVSLRLTNRSSVLVPSTTVNSRTGGFDVSDVLVMVTLRKNG